MNSDEIDRFLRGYLRDFDGVFSVDNMPEDPHLLVCNTDPSDKLGRHWIAIYRRCPCKTSYVHETKFYRRDKKRSGVVVIHIYLLIFKHMSLIQLLISML